MSRLLSPLLLPFLVGTAHAGSHGLVVRLEVSGETVRSSAAVLLTPEGGAPTRVDLKDDGAPPDVTAGDGIWAGSVWLDGDTFEVSAEFDGKTMVGGPASWGPDDTGRDLTVSVSGDTVAIEAGVSGGGVPAGDAPNLPGTEPDPGKAPSPPGSGSPMAGAPASGPSGNRNSSGGDGSLYIGFGVGLLLLVGVAWLWLRGRPGEGSHQVGGIAAVPEPGLLGPGSPSLSDGLQIWLVSEADASALVRPLLATLADRRRVLFVAPSEVAAPPTFGGPVFRAPNIRPSHVGDAAESLQGRGDHVAVLLAQTKADAATIKDYADLLPTGVGAVCLLTQDPEVPTIPRVSARREGAGWIVQTSERTLHLVEGSRGFVEEPPR